MFLCSRFLEEKKTILAMSMSHVGKRKSSGESFPSRSEIEARLRKSQESKRAAEALKERLIKQKEDEARKAEEEERQLLEELARREQEEELARKKQRASDREARETAFHAYLLEMGTLGVKLVEAIHRDSYRGVTSKHKYIQT